MSTEGAVLMRSTCDPSTSGEPLRAPSSEGSYGYGRAQYGGPGDGGPGYGGDDPAGGGRYGRYGAGPYGYGGPAGPGGPHGYGYGGSGGDEGPRGRLHLFRRGTTIIAVALAAGFGTFFGLGGANAGSGTGLASAQIETQIDPGLVDVVATLGYEQAESAGTGLVLTPSGEILTNNHVIEGATSVTVTDVGNGQSYKARVVGYDESKDVAVLRLRGASHLRTVKLGNSDSAAVGQDVMALGNAGGKGGIPSVAIGRIVALDVSITAADEGSGTTEQLTGLINDDAPIQPGDSGGPLVNGSGQVIGIDTAASNTMQFRSQAQTEAFAIPINEALSLADQIEAGHGSPTVHIGPTGFLGVEVESANRSAGRGAPGGSGAVVAGVLPGTPAAGAGLARGDVITSVNGTSVSSPTGLQAALEQHHPGDGVRIGWTSPDGHARSAAVTLANGPAE
jgi:S1-C subfamily serine protease